MSTNIQNHVHAQAFSKNGFKGRPTAITNRCVRCGISTLNKPKISCTKSDDPGGNLCLPCSNKIPESKLDDCHMWSLDQKSCHTCDTITDELFHCVICNEDNCTDCITEWSMRAFIYNNNSFFCCNKCFPDKFRCDKNNTPLYHGKEIMGPADRMMGYCFACDQYHDLYLKNDDTFCPLLEDEIPPMINKIWKLKFAAPSTAKNTSSAPPTETFNFLKFYNENNPIVNNPNRRGDSIPIHRSFDELVETSSNVSAPKFFVTHEPSTPTSGNHDNKINFHKKGSIKFDTSNDVTNVSNDVKKSALEISLSNEVHKLSVDYKNLQQQFNIMSENFSNIKNPYYRNKNGNLVRDQFSFTKDQIAFKDDSNDQKSYNQAYVDKLNEDKNKATSDAYNSGFSNGYNAALRQFQSVLYNSQQTASRQPFQSNQITYYDNSDLDNDNFLNYNFNPRPQNSYYTQPQNDFNQSQNNFNQPRSHFIRNSRRNRGNGRRFTPRR